MLPSTRALDFKKPQTQTFEQQLIKCNWKVFTALHFFHILLCYSLIPKWRPNLFYINSKLIIIFGFNISWKIGFPVVQDITHNAVPENLS